MTIIIRDENGNEEIVQNNTELPTRNFIIGAILFLIWIFWSSGVGAGIFMLLGYIFIGYLGIFGGEKITIDTGIKAVIVEKRTITNKKLEWKETKKINFSDIKEITVTEQYDSNIAANNYYTELILVDGEKQNLSYVSDINPERAKNLALKFCELIGINGHYIDEKKKSIMLASKISHPAS